MTEEEESIIYGDGFSLAELVDITTPDPDVDPAPGTAFTHAEVVAMQEARIRRLERKAAAANTERERMRRSLGRSFQAHADDVAEIFTLVLDAELQGRPVPTRVMPPIDGIVVDPLRGAMYFDGHGGAIKSWIEARHPARRL